MNITLVHAGALGDTLLLAPLLRGLQQRWPDATRTVVTRHSFGRLLVEMNLAEHAADGDDPIHASWFAADSLSLAPPPVPRPGRSPAWSRCDLLISAVSNGRDSWADHARRFSTARRFLFFNPLPPSDFPGHVSEYHRRQLAALNLPEPALPPARLNPGATVVIHPGGGAQEKCWSLENFIQVGRELLAVGRRVEFVLGEAEIERLDAAQVSLLARDFRVHQTPGLGELAKLFRQAAVYLGNDSGPTHLAGVTGIPTVAIFISSNARLWRPIGPRIWVLLPGRIPPAPGELARRVCRLAEAR